MCSNRKRAIKKILQICSIIRSIWTRLDITQRSCTVRGRRGQNGGIAVELYTRHHVFVVRQWRIGFLLETATGSPFPHAHRTVTVKNNNNNYNIHIAWFIVNYDIVIDEKHSIRRKTTFFKYD